jgi:WD40 repeat protein
MSISQPTDRRDDQDVDRLLESEKATKIWEAAAASATPAPSAPTAITDDMPNGPALDAELGGSIPAQVGRFRLLKTLGQGGCGIVFLAHDPTLKRALALKVPRPETIWNPEMRQRFLREGRAAAGLDHPNLVPVFEVGESGAICYIASAYCPGLTLRDWLHEQSGPVPPRAAAALGAVLAEAVHYIHGQGILHRDLKPSNVLLVAAPGEPSPAGQTPLDEVIPKLTDFGLAKMFLDSADAGGLTRTGMVFGTPRYMSPEQAQGRSEALGPGTDVYALGVILYEMLAGEVPFPGSSDLDTYAKIVAEEPRPLSRLRPNVHRDLDTICLKCLEKEPERRYPSALELAQDLRRFLNGEPILARACGRLEKAWRWCRRHPARAGLVGLAAAVVAVVLPAGLWYQGSLNQARESAQQAHTIAVLAQRAQEAADKAKRAAEKAEEAARETARTQEYFALLHGARQRISQKQLGWTWQAAAALRAAAELKTSSRDPFDLRNGLAACLAGVDLRAQKTLPLPMNAARLVFSADGRFLAAAQERAGGFVLPCSVVIIGMGGEPMRTLSFTPRPAYHGGKIVADGARALALSPNGKFLAVGTRSSWIHCWDLSRPAAKPLSWQAADQGEIQQLAFSPSQHVLFSSAPVDRSLRRWNAETGKETGRFQTPDLCRSFALRPDGKELICCSGGQILSLDAATFTTTHPVLDRYQKSGMGPALICCSADGRFLAIEADRKILLLDGATLEEIRRFPTADREEAHAARPNQLAFSPAGDLLYSSSETEDDRKLKVWAVASGRLLATLVVGTTGPLAFAPHPGGKLLASTAGTPIQLHEIAGNSVETVLAHQPMPVQCLAFSADGRALACGGIGRSASSQQDYVSVWDLAGCKAQFQRTFPVTRADPQPALVFHPHEHLLAATGWSREIIFLDRQGRPSPRNTEAEVRDCLGFDPDGKRIWAVVNEDTLASWTWPEVAPATRWQNSAAAVISGRSRLYALAAGRNWVLAGGRDGLTRLVRSQDGQVERLWPGPGSPVRALTLSGDERWAALGFQEGEIRLIRIPSGEVAAVLNDHGQGVTALDFSPDGRLLAAGFRDGRVHLYHCSEKTCRLVLSLTLPSGPVTALKFQSGGRKLALAIAPETAVRFWNLDRLWDTFRKMKLAEGD